VFGHRDKRGGGPDWTRPPTCTEKPQARHLFGKDSDAKKKAEPAGLEGAIGRGRELA